jgi:lipoate-protein ligase B
MRPFFPISTLIRVTPSLCRFCHRRRMCPNHHNPSVSLLKQPASCLLLQDEGQFTSVKDSMSSSDNANRSYHHRRSRHVVKLYNVLSQGCIQYETSWAWQQMLLNRRLRSKRNRQGGDKTMNTSFQHQQPQQRQQQNQQLHDDYNDDCILMLEHAPVYTLGRGADENHLTFFQKRAEKIGTRICENNIGNDHQTSSLSVNDNDVQTTTRWKLSRRARGPGTARLSFDRHMEERLGDKFFLKPRLPMEDAMELVQSILTAQAISPVHAPNGVPIFRVERGGEVTFHGPQQLVVYPLLDLQCDNNNHTTFQQDLHWYLRHLEEVVIQTLQDFGIEGATRDDVNTGVWVDQKKVAAVGISASRWITTHGLALNVDPDLSYFDTSMILPCGVEGRGVTSMAELLRTQATAARPTRIPTLKDVAEVVAKNLEKVFEIELQQY